MVRLLPRSGILLAVFCLYSTSAVADWPKFRGPDGTGHSKETGLPLEWKDADGETNNITWKTPIPGEGWSSPVVVDDAVYLTTAVPDVSSGEQDKLDRSLRLIRINAKTGKLVWEKEVFVQKGKDAPGIHTKNSHASPTPIVSGNDIFVHFGHQGTARVQDNGDIRWKSTELKYPPIHGNGGSPILVGDNLIFSCDGKSDPFVVALNKSSGAVAWKTPRETDAKKKFSFSTPAVFEINGRPQVISPGSNCVCAFDPDNGDEIWRCNYDGYSVIPKPIYGHGLLFIGTGYDSATLMAIRPGESGNVSDSNVEWVIKKRAPHTPSFLLIGDELYFVADNGIASCVDAKTGKVHWQERSGARSVSASPIYADGRIYLQDEHGKCIVLAPGKEFKVLAENQLEGKSLSSFAVDDGAFFIRTENLLYRIGKQEP